MDLKRREKRNCTVTPEAGNGGGRGKTINRIRVYQARESEE